MASDKMMNFTDENFEAEVLKAETPTLIDFWATWCAPCRAIAPHVEAVADSFHGKLRVGKMDIDSSQKTPTKYGVSSIPTLLLFANGKVVGQLVGAVSKAKLEQFVKDQLGKVQSA